MDTDFPDVTSIVREADVPPAVFLNARLLQSDSFRICINCIIMLLTCRIQCHAFGFLRVLLKPLNGSCDWLITSSNDTTLVYSWNSGRKLFEAFEPLKDPWKICISHTHTFSLSLSLSLFLSLSFSLSHYIYIHLCICVCINRYVIRGYCFWASDLWTSFSKLS